MIGEKIRELRERYRLFIRIKRYSHYFCYRIGYDRGRASGGNGK